MAERPDSPMFYPQYDPGQTDSEPDEMEQEDIPSLPTPLQKPLSTNHYNSQAPSNETLTVGVVKQESETVFRPVLDVPKQRKQRSRYHTISQVKVEDPPSDQEVEVQASAAYSVTGDLRQEREGSATNLKVERKSAKRKRFSHDPATGLSTSKNAVDFRERRSIEIDYQERFVELLDLDIVQKVDKEGGITPRGRLLKAGVRMLERVKEERKLQLVPSTNETSTRNVELLARAQKAERQLEEYRSGVEALWKRLN